MKRFNLFEVEVNNHTFRLFEVIIQNLCWEVRLFHVTRDQWEYGGTSHWTEVAWNLISWTSYHRLSVSTVRADIWFWGKQYRWDWPPEEPNDDLPF